MGTVAARTGGGGRMILMHRWGVCSWVVVVGDVGMGMLAEGAESRGGVFVRESRTLFAFPLPLKLGRPSSSPPTGLSTTW